MLEKKIEEKLNPQINLEDARRVSVEVDGKPIEVIIDKNGNSAIEALPEGITEETKPDFLGKVNDSLQNALIKTQETRKKQNLQDGEFEDLKKFKEDATKKMKGYAKTILELKDDKAEKQVITDITYKDAIYAEMKERGIDIKDSEAVEDFMATPDYIDAQSNANLVINKANAVIAERQSQSIGITLQKEQQISSLCIVDNLVASDVIATAKAKGVYNNPNFSAQDMINLHKHLHPQRQLHRTLNTIEEIKVNTPFVLPQGSSAHLGLTPLLELTKEEAKIVLADKKDPRTIEFRKTY